MLPFDLDANLELKKRWWSFFLFCCFFPLIYKVLSQSRYFLALIMSWSQLVRLPNFDKEPDLVDEAVPAMVCRVSTPRAAVSVPGVESPLSGVNHDRAEGHSDQPAPGGLMDIGALSRSGR